MTGREPTRRIWQPPWHPNAGYAIAYVGIALFASWPLCLSPASTISIGFENEATVPLLNVWTMWWNADRLAAGFHGYWNAPIFFPTPGTFAFSEAQPTMLLLAPLVWLTGSRVLAYNVYLLAILSLNGWTSERLLRRVGHHPWLAFCGGVMCQMLPFVWWQSGVVQLTTLFGIVWTVHALLDVFHPHQTPAETDPRLDVLQDQPVSRLVLRGLRLGGAFCLTYLLCNYWGMFLALLLVPSSVWLWNASVIRWKFWLQIGTAALLSIAVLGPLVYVQKSLATEHQWSREQSWIRDLSAHARDFLDTPRTTPAPADGGTQDATTEVVDTDSSGKIPDPIEWSRVPRLDFPEEGRGDLWPLGGGSLKLLLAPVGLLASLFIRGRRRWGLFAATFALSAFGLSLGPTVWFRPWVPVVGGQCVYEILQQYVPGFALIRSPFRFALFVQLGVVWLSIEALDLLNPARWRRSPVGQRPTVDASEPGLSLVSSSEGDTVTPWVHPALRNPPPSIVPHLIHGLLVGSMVVFGLVLVTEVWPPRQSQYKCPSAANVPAWVLWLRENSVPTDAVVCLPFPTGYVVGDYEETTLWMYWGSLHHRPLVNGYSGFFPQRFVDLKEKLSHFQPIEGDQTGEPRLNYYPWDSAGLKELNGCQARFVIVKRSFASRDDVWRHPVTKFRWAWVTSDEEHQLDVYEIQPSLLE